MSSTSTGLEIDFQFDAESIFRPLEVYMTAMHLMVELARRPWEQALFAMIADHIDGFNVVIMFLNPQAPSEAKQLLICHCVLALWRAVILMTDGVMFCKLRAIIKVRSFELGALNMSPINTIAGSVNETSRNALDSGDETAMNNSDDAVSFDRGRLVDPDNFLFVIEYLWYGKSMRSKDISLAFLGAIATAAPHDRNSECEKLETVSPEGNCIVVVDQVGTTGTRLTYYYAVRALQLAYDQIFVRQKRWGDLLLMLRFNDRSFGEIRVLKGVGKETGTAPV
ncbi:MAG: hypothetical protein Q9195_009598 [Heterodermia aff. obscurata]